MKSVRGVAWRAWSGAAFAEARARQAPVLLAIGAQWCAGTAAMRRAAWADPDVAALAADRFVPVRVDADARPDLADRYTLGGWPTTAFLTPDGDLLGGETYATAARLRDLLPRVADAFHAQRRALAERRAPPPRRPAPPPGARPDPGVAAWLADHLLAAFDPEHAGFGRGPKRPHPDALTVAARRARAGDPAFAPLVDRTLRQIAWGGLSDPRDGGVFRYCARRDWTAPATEKLLDVQAAVLRLLLARDDDAARARAASLIAYVRRTLSARAPGPDGGLRFFANQQAILDDATPDDDAAADAAPPVDRTVYADRTAAMAQAWTQAADVLDDVSLLEDAVTAIEHVAASTYERGGGIAHRIDDPATAGDTMADGPPTDTPAAPAAGDEPPVRGLLVDQVAASAALLDLHAATDRDVYRDLAQELMQFALRHLWDTPGGGGFLDRVHAPDDIGRLREPLRPFAANCDAARVLLRLARLTAQPAFRDRAAAVLAALAPSARAHGVDAAAYVLAVEDLLTPDDARSAARPLG